MSSELITKIIRCSVVALLFMCMTSIIGLPIRYAHEHIFMLSMIVLFSLLLRNIWATLFLTWTAFLYIYFRFQIGEVYLRNIFLGGILYYLVKISFKKEHIDFFIKGVLWVLALNIGYIVIQMLGFDFIYRNVYGVVNDKPIGFMANTGVMGAFLVMCIPLLMTRGRKQMWLGLSLIPIVLLTRGRVNYLACGVVTLFVLYFAMNRKFWIGLVCVSLLGFGGLMIKKPPSDERFQMWKMALTDCVMHPISGWGLDSFRNTNENKNHLFVISPEEKPDGRVTVSVWDNPHNLYISLFYEFGVVVLLLLIGYWRQLGMWFSNAVKEPNTIGLAGFILAFFIISLGHFPAHLVRMMVFIIPVLALYEVQVK